MNDSFDSPVFFSIVTFVDSLDGLKRHIETISKNIIFQNDNLEVILLDPWCTNESITECEKFTELYGHNIIPVYACGASLADCYNLGIIKSRGLYINFSLSSSFFDNDSLDHIYNTVTEMECPELVSMAPFTVNELEIYSQYLISPRIYDGKRALIDLNDNSSELSLCLQCYFIKKSSIKNNDFVYLFAEYGFDTAQNYIMRLLINVKKYVYVSYSFYHYTIPLEDNSSAYLGQYDIDWYLKTMTDSLMAVISENANRDCIPLYTQRMILWSVFSRFNCNYNDRDKCVLNETDLQIFYNAVSRILNYVDDKTIWNKGDKQTYTIPRTIRLLMLNIKDTECVASKQYYKYGDCLWKIPSFFSSKLDEKNLDYSLEKSTNNTNVDTCDGSISDRYISQIICGDENFSVVSHRNYSILNKYDEANKSNEKIKPIKICNLNNEHVILDIINYSKGCFSIDGRCSIGDFQLEANLDLYILVSGRKYHANKTEIYRANKMFGKTYQKPFRFHVDFYAYTGLKNYEIVFMIAIDGEERQLKIRTGSIYAHVSSEKYSFWKYDSDSYMRLENDKLIISSAEDNQFSKMEELFERRLLKLDNEFAIKSYEIRKLYFEEKNKKNKEIWVTFDKLYKAGDNGEYMYQYIRKHDSEIEIYYLIKEDSPDYERLMDEDSQHILVWGQNETVVKMLLADVILATHANVASNAGIDKQMFPYLSDLFCPFIVCIQHGLTVQNIAQYQNRVFDNTQFYTLASIKEYRNINTPIYGYTSEQLSLTGMARYDGLKNKAIKQILISPTWRRNVANSNIAHFKKAHNEYFKHSEYFRIYNSLINDCELIQCAKEYGYKIIYLIHPAASSQIDDFDKNDYVEIIPAAGNVNYEKILTESALMVTDYSGIQFDFAYMKKPILYYHPEELPPHYEESEAYVYNRDAFGPIITKETSLVKTLCEYIKNNCVMNEEYIQRVERFFAYNDFDNCKRIYNAVKDCMITRKVSEYYE